MEHSRSGLDLDKTEPRPRRRMKFSLVVGVKSWDTPPRLFVRSKVSIGTNLIIELKHNDTSSRAIPIIGRWYSGDLRCNEFKDFSLVHQGFITRLAQRNGAVLLAGMFHPQGRRIV